MAKIWEPQDINIYKNWVSDIMEEASDKLSSWEASFIDSLTARLLRGQNLTQAQAEKLESIYAEKTK